MKNATRLLAMFALLFAFGCAKTPPPGKSTTAAAVPTPVPVSIENRTWDLVSLSENTNPLGAGGKPATLRLDSATRRASGSAGCNRYSGPYALVGDSLTFGAAMATKMACPDGMELETSYLKALDNFMTWSATDSTLTLSGGAGPLAVFRAE
jgi:putative lipoprotein